MKLQVAQVLGEMRARVVADALKGEFLEEVVSIKVDAPRGANPRITIELEPGVTPYEDEANTAEMRTVPSGPRPVPLQGGPMIGVPTQVRKPEGPAVGGLRPAGEEVREHRLPQDGGYGGSD